MDFAQLRGRSSVISFLSLSLYGILLRTSSSQILGSTSADLQEAIREYTKGAYGIFYAVVINFYSSVVYVSGKPWKKRVRIFNSFTHAAFRKHSKISILQPLFKFKYQRIGLTDTFFLTLFSCESGLTGIRLYLVQPTDVVNRLCDQRPVFFQGIHVLPSAMCPTADQSDSFHLLKLFVSCIAIALHNATVAFQQFTGYHTRTAATVIMEHMTSPVTPSRTHHSSPFFALCFSLSITGMTLSSTCI